MKPVTHRKIKNRGAYRKTVRLSTRLASPAATAALGRRVLTTHPAVHVWLLRGHLGTGKTTLVRGMLRSLGVRRAVTSPTFTLSKQYTLQRQPWQRVVHIDGYRIRDKSELAALEVPELLIDPSTLLLVEWPERLADVDWGRHGFISLRRDGLGRRAVVRLRR